MKYIWLNLAVYELFNIKSLCVSDDNIKCKKSEGYFLLFNEKNVKMS